MTAVSDTLPHTRGYDLLFALPVAVFYGFAAIGNTILIERQWQAAISWFDGMEIVEEVVMLAFFGLQAVLLLVRRLPVASTDSLWPRAIAILGANFSMVLLALPRVTLHGWWASLSYALTFVGTAAAIAVLAWLGRSFSIFPSARSLVTNGPYRVIRHPLYLAEFVATLGIMLQFVEPWSLLVAAVAFGFQLKRMDAEEALLNTTYPQYADYSRRTSKLLPGVY